MQETQVVSLGWEDPLEKEMATHFSILSGASKDKGAWWTTVNGVENSQTQLSHEHFHFQAKVEARRYVGLDIVCNCLLFHLHNNYISIPLSMCPCILSTESRWHISLLHYTCMVTWLALENMEFESKDRVPVPRKHSTHCIIWLGLGHVPPLL